MLLEFANSLNIKNKHVGPINEASRGTFDGDYFSTLKRTKIILSCQPENWEGDSRTWEALSSGALLFLDETYTPVPNPLEHEKHVVFYNPNDLDDLKDKIEYYLSHTDEADKIAKNGFNHAMKYHRTINRIDHILKVIGKD